MKETKERERVGRRDWDHQTMTTVGVMTVHCLHLMCPTVYVNVQNVVIDGCSSMFDLLGYFLPSA